MSTETQKSPQQGDSRRRRSRGRQNRNNNNNNRHDDQGRQSSSNNRSGRQSGSGQVKRRSMPAAKLSWWQKLLKALGFGAKEAVRPPRPERRPDKQEPKQSQEPRRSKTRDARSEATDSPEANNGRKRREQGDRNNTRQRGGDPSTVENRRVYVGNLSYETTESDLEELFKGVGAVRRVEIVYNRSTHRSKGYGFVEMLDIDEAKRTVEVLHDQFFMGRKITVSGAKSKDYDEAEKAEGPVEATQNIVPPLAPIEPVKEEVMDLSPEPVAEVVSEAAPEAATEESPDEEPKQAINA
jgi:hypothetical protein